MSSWLRVPDWKVRVLGASVGSVVAVASTVLTLPLVFPAIIAAFGIPAGAIVGGVFGPRLAVAHAGYGRTVLRAAVAAFVLGSAIGAAWFTASESRGASVGALIEFAVTVAWWFPVAAAGWSAPMSLAAAVVAARTMRALAPRASSLWIPSAVVIAGVVITSGAAAVSAVTTAGDEAAAVADRVALEYVAISAEPDAWHLLEVRSYWEGELAGGSGTHGFGCAWSRGDIQSDWAIWVTADDGAWHDRPTGRPLVSAAEYGRGQPVSVTIRVDRNGVATWQPGVDGRHC